MLKDAKPVKILLCGEAFGDQEQKLGQPFVGPSGIELLRMLGEAGVIALSSFDRDYIHRYYQTSDPTCVAAIWDLHPEITRTNVFNLHPPKNDLEWFCGTKAEGIGGYPALLKSKYVRTQFFPEIERLGDEIISHNPNIIICLGNVAIWALAGRGGVTKLRGTTFLSSHTVSGYKLLATFHPAAVLRQWDLRPTAIADLMKANRESEFPEIKRPQREIWIEPTIDDIETFYQEHILGSHLLSTDIETSGNQITCIGFAPSPDHAIVIPFYDDRRKGRHYWESAADEVLAWRIVRRILEDPKILKLFQNGTYDIAFLWRSMKIKVLGASEDSMLLSHALQPESLKGLGYLGSIYSDEGAWKHMRKKDETVKRDA